MNNARASCLEVTDADLQASLDDLLSARETLTRSMLGGSGHGLQQPDEGVHYSGGYAPM